MWRYLTALPVDYNILVWCFSTGAIYWVLFDSLIITTDVISTPNALIKFNNKLLVDSISKEANCLRAGLRQLYVSQRNVWNDILYLRQTINDRKFLD
jgi:hypothetical protein